MDAEMDEEPHSPETDVGEPGEPCPHPEPRITNRAQGGVRSDKTRFIRPVERQRMRPWLIDHLDKNDIPGLAWQDREEKIFRISWKHAANQCFNMQKDTNLFERWAIHTGRHQDSDHKRWKANFRCALNSLPDVTEMKEQGVKKGNNAFKVYRFLNEKEAKVGKDGKPRKKRDPADLIYREEAELMKLKDDFRPFTALEVQQGSSFELEVVGGAASTSLPDLHQLVPGPSGVDLLLEADSKERVQPVVGGMDNLQEILAAATNALAAGSDAQALEKISIEQLSRLGEVSRMRLDIRQSDRKRRKKEVSGILNVFLCNWCEKVFPTKTDLFQHFLVIHQDKLLSGEEYGVRKPAEHSEKLQQEIEDLEKKVLGFTQETYQQKDSEEVIIDGQVVDLSSNNSMTSQEVYIEDQVLDLSVAGALARVPQPQLDVALDLSMNTSSKQKGGQKNGTPKIVQKRRRSNTSDVNYNVKFGNYGLAGAPRTKRQMSLLLKRKEEEEEKQRKQAEAQHSMEDIVHAEILMSLKSGSKDENETENADLDKENENDNKGGSETIIKIEVDRDGRQMNGLTQTKTMETGEEEANYESEKNNEKEVNKEDVASSRNLLYLKFKDGSKITVSETIEKSQKEIQTGTDEAQVFVESSEEADSVTIVKYDERGSSGKPYKCALCVERFEDPTELLQHVSIHKTEYTCSVCMKVMTDKNIYLNHIESHLPHVKYKEKATVETVGKALSNSSSNKNVKKGSETSKDILLKNDETNLINEKGAADVNKAGEQSAEDKRNDSNKIYENTGQKNLQGEPAVNPVAGSDNLTGIVDSTRHKEGKINTDSEKKGKPPTFYSKQDSFELAIDCLQDTNKLSSLTKDVRNDVVDGEQKERAMPSKAENFELERYTKSFVQPNREGTSKQSEKKTGINKGNRVIQSQLNVSSVSEVGRKQLIASLHGTSSVKEKLTTAIGRTKLKTSESVKDLRVIKCEICSETFESSLGLNNHLLLHKETIEEKIRKNVFHCGLCDRELHINDVHEHLQSHRSGQRETKEVQLNYDYPCMICEQVVPVKRFNSHLKSHSVYELSQAQNLLLAQASAERKEGSKEGRKPFVCNLCNFKFETFSDLKSHVKTHLGPRIVKTESAGHDVLEVKPTVSAKLSLKQITVKGKKRKVFDEKKTAVKRQKEKLNVKDRIAEDKHKTKIKEDFTEVFEEKPNTVVAKGKTETSSVIAAALKSGPKYETSALVAGNSKTDLYLDLKTELIEGVTSETKLGTDLDSSVSKLGKIEKFLKSGEVILLKEDKVLKHLKEDKRKVKSQQYDSKPLKRQKLAAEDTSAHSNIESDDHTVQSVSTQSAEDSSSIDEMEDHASFQELKAQTTVNDKLFPNKEQNVYQVKKTEMLPKITSERIIKVASEESSQGTNVQRSDTQSPQQKLLLLQKGTSKLASPDLTEKDSGPLSDSSSLGTNVLPSTLRNLQQKILLVKQGAFTVATPFFGPTLATNASSHQPDQLSINNANRSTKVPAFEAVNKEKSSAETTDGVTLAIDSLSSAVPVCMVKNAFHTESYAPLLTSSLSQQTKKMSTSCMKQLEASQKLLLAAANVSTTTTSINVQSSSQCAIGGQMFAPTAHLPSPTQVAGSLDLTSAINISQLLAAVSTLCKSKASAIESLDNDEQLQSSVSDVSASKLSFSPPTVQFSIGSLQKQSGVYPVSLLSSNTSAIQVDAKASVLADNTLIDKEANTASTISTILKSQQQQQQLNMIKLNQPSVNKPSLASILPTQINMQHALPSVYRFQNQNLFVPKPNTEDGKETSKLSNFQLVWLPVSQVSNVAAQAANQPGPNQTCIFVPGTSASGILSDNQESTASMVTASKQKDSLPKSIQPNIGHLSSIVPSGQTIPQTSVPDSNKISNILSNSESIPSNPVSSISAKEIVTVSLSSNTLPSLQSLETVQCNSSITTVQSVSMMPTVSPSTTLGLSGVSSSAIKPDGNLILACGICKQALGTLEQMNSHNCKLQALNQTGQRFVTLTRLSKPSTTAGCSVNSSLSVGATGTLHSALSPASQPMKMFVVPATIPHPNILTTSADASKATVISVTPALSTAVVTSGLHPYSPQVVPKLFPSQMSSCKQDEMNTIETPTVDSGIMLQRSENPHYVYFFPTPKKENGTLSKATVHTVNATPMKIQTCVTEPLSNTALFSLVSKEMKKTEDLISSYCEPTLAVLSKTTEENLSAVKDLTTNIMQESAPSVAMPYPLSVLGHKLRAKALSNICRTTESTVTENGENDKGMTPTVVKDFTLTSMQQPVPVVAMQKPLPVEGQKALSNPYGTCCLKENSSSDSGIMEDATEKFESCIQVAEASKRISNSDTQTTEGCISSESEGMHLKDQIITLYPCVICKQTFTFDQFMKHTKKHLTVPGNAIGKVSNQHNNTSEDDQFMEVDHAYTDAKITDTVEEFITDKSNSKGQNLESLRQSDIYRCYLCFSSHDSESSLSKHYRKAHPKMATHLCPADDCAQLFIKIQEVDVHYASEHQHECKLCLQRFRTYVEFQAHVKQHYLNKKLRYLVCCKCGTHFASRKAFSNHCKITLFNRCSGTYVEKFIECQQCHCCSVNFRSNECLKLHFKRKWYQKIAYRCWICKDVVLSEAMYKNHVATHMSASDQEFHISFCHTCCIMFPNRNAQSEHMKLSSHVETTARKKKSFVTASETDFSKRIRAGHKDGTEDANENELEVAQIMVKQNLTTCKQCNMCFATMFELKQHKVIRHKKVWKFESAKSFAKTRTQYYGIYSTRCSKQNRTVVCELCGTRFFSIRLLRQHIDVSHEVKTFFACKNPECDKNFNSVFESETHVCESLSSRKEEAENSNIFVDMVQPCFKTVKEYVLQYYVEDCRQLLDKVASTVESVQEHLGDHFLCQYCNKRFAYCEKLKSHLIVQHADILSQCVDCQEYFFHWTTLLEHRRDCAVKGFSDEDFHTKKKVLGCDVCLNSFMHILGLTKYLRDVKFLSEKNKSSASKCMTRKGVFDLKCEEVEENTITFNNSRKFVCISCKNEYCNAEDFYICMKARLVIERNKPNEELDEATVDANKEGRSGVGGARPSLKVGRSLVDLQNVFFCHDCEAIICYEEGGMCAASLKHSCNGSETII